MKQHIKQFFEFLEKKEDKRIPLKAKLLNPKDYKIDPEDLNVKGSLDLIGTPIQSLPDNLTVQGTLHLLRTPIQSLPDNLKVGRWLVLKKTAIDSIPNNLKVGEVLFLVETPLAKKYTEEQIRSMIEEKGGYVKGRIKI
jgi:hypothetical protein